jgi:hypothetical protein
LSLDVTVVVPPATLLEIIRTANAERRRRIVDVLLGGKRQYLPTEAESECREFVEEVRRLRPAWLRAWPRTDRVASLNAFWTKRIWRQARTDLDRLVEKAASMGARDRERVIAMQRFNQTALRTSGVVLDLPHMEMTLLPNAPPEIREGWNADDALEPWRLNASMVFWHALVKVKSRAAFTGEDTTLSDWVEAYVRLDRLSNDRADYNRFWFYEVEAARMPRNWLRWAVQTEQWKFHIGPGNPGDEQQTSYLLDCDLYVTADHRFSLVLSVVRSRCPAPMADIRFIDRDADSVVAALKEAIIG